MGKIILPKIYVEKLEWPLIFLEGPIRGAPEWQDAAIEIIFSLLNEIYVANPQRSVKESLQPFLAQGRTDFFPRQRAWERHYIEKASLDKNQKGVVMMWLPKEIEHSCQKSYGAMTRVEFGEIITHIKYNPSTRFCIGTDGDFSEVDTMLYDLSLDAPNLKIFKSLRELCIEAVRIATSSSSD
ncbi:MAG: hypothetical protein Q8Q31_00270 [Nanoarchaeota archaeon]|nr:hypothetical protein [Nanoarchaeota archaeon]